MDEKWKNKFLFVRHSKFTINDILDKEEKDDMITAAEMSCDPAQAEKNQDNTKQVLATQE